VGAPRAKRRSFEQERAARDARHQPAADRDAPAFEAPDGAHLLVGAEFGAF
jgi:hypothetical protein